MLRLTAVAAILALAIAPAWANVAPPEEPPPAAPAAETPATPDAPSSTEPPEVMEGTTPPVETAPEAPTAEAAAETTDAAAVTEAPAEASGSNTGTIIGVLALLAAAAGAGYWFMNRKA